MDKIDPDTYDLWKTTPPEPSEEELFIEGYVDMRMNPEYVHNSDWFEDVIDWDKVEKHLREEAKCQWEYAYDNYG